VENKNNENCDYEFRTACRFALSFSLRHFLFLYKTRFYEVSKRNIPLKLREKNCYKIFKRINLCPLFGLTLQHGIAFHERPITEFQGGKL
jgi:hypothetical protein